MTDHVVENHDPQYHETIKNHIEDHIEGQHMIND